MGVGSLQIAWMMRILILSISALPTMMRQKRDYWLRQLVQTPCQGQGDDEREQEGGPVAEVILGNGFHDKVHMNEVGFQRDGSHERQRMQQPPGSML